ncbi:MAG: ThuA domain-containing protein, partial [Verrucomicrobiota bacterium]
TEAFDKLDHCDLFIAAGLNWTGMGVDGGTHEWKFDTKSGYRPATKSQKETFCDYVASGKPVMGFHAGIASYDDWPEFGQLLGARWDWKVSNHGPVTRWTMDIINPEHPIAANIKESDYTLEEEEVYVNLQFPPDSKYEVVCQANFHGAKFPILLAGEGGRCKGAGRWAYFGNGHSERSTECPTFKPLFINTILWLMGEH